MAWIIGGVVAVLVLALVTGAVLLSHRSTSATPTTAPRVAHLAVLDATPTNAATVDSTASIRVALNAPLAANSPLPTLSPAVAGHWERLSPSVLTFVQSSPLSPGQSVTLTVPGGANGLVSTTGARLARSSTSSFQVAPLSTLRVQQLLAELNYLPVTFTPSAPSIAPGISTANEAGTFSWRWSTLPATLTSQWSAGASNVITQGAIMNFENLHNMTPDGQAGPQVWNQLLADRAASKGDPNPYTYVYVAQTASESLTLYSNGSQVYQSPVNTGIQGARTAVGTFPVFEHLRVTTMSGTNPDGTKYHDTGIPWTSYFHGGDALHGFIRASYGTPQSDGCVEMPFANAGIVWPQTPIGTLVTVGPLATA
jgi:peptidoglycan hydrolase-like protein with peptidoglycan-binding domain